MASMTREQLDRYAEAPVTVVRKEIYPVAEQDLFKCSRQEALKWVADLSEREFYEHAIRC